jgi:hypothetical protein
MPLEDEIDAVMERLKQTTAEHPGMRQWLASPDAEPLFGTDRTRPALRFERKYEFKHLRDCDPFAVLLARLCTHYYGVPDAEDVTDIHSDYIEAEDYEKAVRLASLLREFVSMEPTDPRWLAIVGEVAR